MIDFHSHILPGIDDGAKNVEEALSMLSKAYDDGIDTVVSTSHIYIDHESDIDDFLEARNVAYDKLKQAMSKSNGKYPQIKLGCEVHLKNNIDEMKKLKELVVDGTDYILLEMPYHAWKPELYELVYNISVMGVKPLMAHIERFLKYRHEFHNLKSVGAVFQVNADPFLHKSMRKELLELFYDGYVHVLGSDMHNMEDRVNNLKAAYEIIEKYYGLEFAEYTQENALRLLDNKSVLRNNLPNIGFFKRMRL